MKNLVFRSVALASLLACGVLVMPIESRAAEPAPSLSGNLNLVSHYRFRGIDQTWGRPALQGGLDVSWPAGFYAGLWASNVSGNSYPGASLEIDYYAGYNSKLGEDAGWTVGGYGYAYPGGNLRKAACGSAAFAAPCSLPNQRFDTFELNAGLSWKTLSYKVSVSSTDYFGANTGTGYSRGTRGTVYHDLNYSHEMAEGLTLALHLGRTDVRGRYGALSADYTDWRVGLTQGFAGVWSVGASLVGASNNAFFRPPGGGLSAANGDTRALNRAKLVLQAGRTF